MASTRPETLSHFGAQESSASLKKRPGRFVAAALEHVVGWIQPGVWTRVIALFAVLGGIKLLVLARLSKQLFEANWRTNSTEVQPLDYLNFGLFILVGTLTLARLAYDCQRVGARSARRANLAVLSFAIPFLFLTFHQGENNYLYPILAGVLRWSSLLPYLACDLFFNPPFLSLWIAAYGLAYFCLLRTGHEKHCLYLTAAFAAAYAPTFLSHLASYGSELFILNVLGAVALFNSMINPHGSRTASVFLPLTWTVLGASYLFIHAPRDSGLSLKYFMGLCLLTAALAAIGSHTARKAECGAKWNLFIFFYSAVFLLLCDTRFPKSANFNHALCSALAFPRYFLGETGICLGLITAAALICRIAPKLRPYWLDCMALGLITVALVDYRVLQLMGVRLDWNVLELGNSPRMIWRMAKPYLPAVGLALSGIAALYFTIVHRVAKCLSPRNPEDETSDSSDAQPNENSNSSVAFLRSVNIGIAAVMFMIVGCAGLIVANPDKGQGQAGLRLVATSPLWTHLTSRRMNPEQFHQTAAELKIGAPMRAPYLSGPQHDLNVVLVFMESTYNKHLSLFGSSEETQPLLSKYRDRMELYPNFFSTFASSIHARFATFCSLYPTRDFNAFTLQRVPVKSIFEVLHENGYETSLFYSSFLDYTGFREFLANRQIDHLYDADTMPGERHTERVSWGLREEETLGAMREQIKQSATGGKKFFLTYVPAAPHYPYEKVSERFHKYKPVEVGDYTPQYLNELLYMDWVLASLLDQLKESGVLDRTLVVITDDHGEMLGEKGKPIGHGWLLTPELVNAPLIIMDPTRAGPRVNPVVGCQVDLLPTMLERLGIKPPDGELYQGFSLDSTPEDRVMYLNSYQQYALLEGNRLCFGDREREAHDGLMGGTSYIIENEGARTRFIPVAGGLRGFNGISKFDSFQEALLKNYSFYCTRTGGSFEGSLTKNK